MYYRVAIQVKTSTRWQWRSTALSSLDAMLRFLRLYYALPLERLRVFSSSSREEIDEQFARENSGLRSHSVTAVQFLRERMIHVPETKSDVTVRGIRTHRETAAIGIAAKGSLNKYYAEALVSDERYMGVLDSKRVEVECGAGSDHDLPYTFALPGSRPLVLAWVKILAKVHRGELQP
jgi:hypothetical protein